MRKNDLVCNRTRSFGTEISMANSLLTCESPLNIPGAPAVKPTRSRKGLLLKGIALGFAVVLVAEILRIFVGNNFHVVVPGKCYRSAQPTADFLASAQRYS